MRKLILITIALTLLAGTGWSQKQIKRQGEGGETQEQINKRNKEKEKRQREAEAQRQRQAEQRRREAEAKRQREAEARRKREAAQREAEEQRRREAKEQRRREAEEQRRREEEKRKSTTGTLAGHEWVDLGLPSGLKWAICNVGATSPSDYGSYFAWGETSTKSSYNESNSLTYEMSISELRSEGIIGSNGNLTMSHDAARYNWGSTWRMPTKSECQELVDNCTWTWTTQGGTKGYVVTGRNGKSIFLPCAGWRDGTSLNSAGENGYYWSSSPYEEYSSLAHGLYFYSGSHYLDRYCRFIGFSVRPVTE